MTDFRRANEVLDEGEVDDEAKTLIVVNPLAREADEVRAADSADVEARSEADVLDGAFDVDESEIADVSSWNHDLVMVSTEEVMAGLQARESIELLRDSEFDRLVTDSDIPSSESDEIPILTLLPLPAEFQPTSRAKAEPTERITLPQTHPLANSIAPTTAPKSLVPESKQGSPVWQMVAAAAILVGLGAVGNRLHGASQTDASVPVAASVGRSSGDLGPSESTFAAVRSDEVPARAEIAEAPVEEAVAEAAARVDEVEADNPAPEAVRRTEPSPRAVAARQGGQKRAERKAVEAAPRSARPARSEKSAAGQGEVAAQLSREQVVATMGAALPGLSKCTGGRSGVVQAQLTVRNTGKVSYALVQGSFAGTPEGTCLVSALRDVRFPEFGEPSLRLTYPIYF